LCWHTLFSTVLLAVIFKISPSQSPSWAPVPPDPAVLTATSIPVTIMHSSSTRQVYCRLPTKLLQSTCVWIFSRMLQALANILPSFYPIDLPCSAVPSTSHFSTEHSAKYHSYDIINLLKPNVNYSGRTAPLTSKVAFYIFVQQI